MRNKLIFILVILVLFGCSVLTAIGGLVGINAYQNYRNAQEIGTRQVQTGEKAETATPTETPFTGLTINSCPSASLGYHPDSGKPLIFKMYPFGEGDPNVLCEYEIFDLTQEVKVLLPGDITGVNADWSHGTYFLNGLLKNACPTGWKCEGVWVAREDFIVPVGTLVHVFVYIREQPAMVRFTETISWTEPTPGSMAPFACEYVATQGHSMHNIRVPAWAQDQGEVGTIYGFGLPVGHKDRLTCEGYPIDWEPLPGQLTTKP